MSFVDGLLFVGKEPSSRVQVDVGRTGFSVSRESGRALEFAYQTVETDLGGDQQRYLVVRQRGGDAIVYLECAGLLDRLEAAGAPAGFRAQIQDLIQQHRRSRRRTLGAWVGVTALVLVGLGLAAFRLHDWAVDAVPVSWEAELGQRVFDQARQGTPEPALDAMVAKIGDRILATRPNQPYSFEFAVIPAAQINAFAAPGGFIVVHSALIAEAESAEEFAGVLGHEIAHVLLRHTVRSAVAKIGIVSVVALVLDPGGLAELATVLVSLTNLKFSRVHEGEADELGVSLLHEARINPEGMGQFFQRLAETDAGIPELISTHPASENRQDSVRALTEKLPRARYRPVDVDWPAMRALARAMSQSTTDPTSEGSGSEAARTQ